MKKLCMLSVCLALSLPLSGLAATYTVGPGSPDSLAILWYSCGPTDTIRMLPGTYAVGEPAGWWPLLLRSYSPSLVGAGGPEGVILLGTGVEQAFFLEEYTVDARIHFERITFRGLAEIIGRDSPISGAHGELRFSDNIVEDCGAGPSCPTLRTTACWGIVAGNVFRNNHGPAITNYHTSAAIEDNEIYGNPDGIRDQCCTSPPMRGNHVHDNSGIGIDTGYYEGGVIEYNVIEHNGGTGLMVGSHFTVQHNVIRENVRGVSSGGISGSNASIHGNDIYDNTEFNLGVGSNYTQTQDCTMNWWGSVDSLVIAEGILDCYDDPERTCVVFEPFCMSPGCEPTPVEPSSWGSIKALYRR